MSDTNDRIDILVKKNEKTGSFIFSRFALEHHVLISLTRVTYTTHNTHPVSLSHMPTHNNATRILRNTSNTGTRERPVVLSPYVLLSFEDSSPSSPWHVTRTRLRRSFDLHHVILLSIVARLSVSRNFLRTPRMLDQMCTFCSSVRVRLTLLRNHSNTNTNPNTNTNTGTSLVRT